MRYLIAATVASALVLGACGGNAPSKVDKVTPLLEVQLHSALRKDAPPSGGSDPVKWVRCEHETGVLWSCQARDDISILPDITSRYDVTLTGRCWRARISKGFDPTEELVTQHAHGCLPVGYGG